MGRGLHQQPNKRRHTVYCIVCGATFQAAHKKAKTCSSPCRSKKKRALDKLKAAGHI